MKNRAVQASGATCGLVAAALLAALAAALLAASVAWGCIPQPLISVQPRSSGPAGSQVTVEGLAISGGAEIRWNSVEGPRLATASGPHFSVPVTIPQAPEGLYTVIVVERTPNGDLGSSGRAAFLVTPAGTGAGPEAPSGGGGESPTTVASGPAPSSGPGVGMVAAGAAGIAVLAGLGAAWLSRRRRASSP